MGDAALDAVGVADFFAPAGADAWRGDAVGVDAAEAAVVFAGVGVGLTAAGALTAGVFFKAGFDADCAGADFGATACVAGDFLAAAFETAAFFAGAGLADAFFAGAFRAAAFVAGTFFAADLLTDLAAFFATTFLATTFFAAVFFAAGFFAGAAFLAALAAFFAVFFAATGGVSFYSLVTGKRAVIP